MPKQFWKLQCNQQDGLLQSPFVADKYGVNH